MTPAIHLDFPATWQADILPGPPPIAPARRFVLPEAVPGEEDALARGALWLQVRPRTGGTFLLQCALGFAGGNMLHGVWATPEPDVLLAVAGGYAYRVDTAAPEQGRLLDMRPVVQLLAAQDPASLLLVGFHAVYVLQESAEWATPRLSWEGVTITGTEDGVLHGTGWHMRADREVPFTVDLRARETVGGGFLP